MEEQCEIPITKYYESIRKGKERGYILSARKLPDDLKNILDEEFNGYEDRFVAASNLVPIITEKGEPQAVEIIRQLRDVEIDVRNVAAHVIVCITDDKMYEETGYRAKDIMTMLKKFFSYCGVLPGKAWEAYEELNEAIISLL